MTQQPSQSRLIPTAAVASITAREATTNGDEDEVVSLEIEHGTVAAAVDHEAFELESSADSEERYKHHKALGSLTAAVIARYVSLAFLAVIATVTCPGETMLWNESERLHRWNNLARLFFISTMTIVTFCRVHFSDPGFLTAELLDSLHDVEEEVSLMQCCDGNDDDKAFDPLAPPSSASLNGKPGLDCTATTTTTTRRTKHCSVCQFVPLIRSHHCKECNRCVATFDHHCKLVGVCIGEGNRGLFWIFLLCQWLAFVSCCHIVGSSRLGLMTLILPPKGATESWLEILRVVAAKVYLYPLTFIATIMLGMHTFLAVTNMTTFECVKGPRHLDYLKGTRDMDFPFSHGILYNLQVYCRSSIPPCCGRSCFPNQRTATATIAADRRMGGWTPIVWRPPNTNVIRDSEDWWNHPWQNKYWSCC